MHILGFSGNVSRPSRTRVMVETVARRLGEHFERPVDIVDLVDCGWDQASSSAALNPNSVEAVVEQFDRAEILVVGTQVFKGGCSGLFKHFFDLIEPDRLIGKRVVLTASGGSQRHCLVIESQLRPLFSFFMAHTMPTGMYVAETDFDGYRLRPEALGGRLDQIVRELEHPGCAVKSDLHN